MKLRRRSGLAASGAVAAEPMHLPPYLHQRHKPTWARRRTILWIALTFSAFMYGALFAFLPPAFVPPLLLPVTVLALLVIWAWPESAPPDRALWWAYLAFLVSLIGWPSYLAIGLPGLPWINFLRLFAILSAFLFAVGLSVSPELRAKLRGPLKATPAVWKMLLAFTALQFLSIFLSDTPYTSFQRFFINQIYWTVAFFCACYLFLVPGRARVWSILLAVVALWVSAIGFWEWRLGRVPWAGHIPAIFKIQDEIVARILSGTARTATKVYRVQSTSTTSIGLAEFLAMTTPFFIHFMMTTKKVKIRIAATVSLVVLLVTIINTDARLGMMGFLLAFLIYAGFWGIRRWKFVKGSLFGPAITISYPVIVLLFFATTIFSGRLRNLVWGDGEHQFSNDARMTQLQDGLPMILNQPFGHGVARAAAVLGFRDPSGLITIDNYYLSLGLDYGIAGLALFILMFLAAIWYGARALLASEGDDESALLVPIMTALLIFLVIKTVLSQDANHPIAFMLLGMNSALVYRAWQQRDRSTPICTGT